MPKHSDIQTFNTPFHSPPELFPLQDLVPLEYGYTFLVNPFKYDNMHGRYMLMLIKSGSGTLNVGGREISVLAPTGIIIYPEEIFTIASNKGATLEFAHVRFCGTLSHLFSRLPRFFPYSEELFSFLSQNTEPTGARLFLISSLLHKCCYTLGLTENCKKSIQELHVNTSLMYINHHFSPHLCCKEVADNMLLGEKYLSRCFKAVIGQSLREVIIKKRMTVAMDLLSSGTTIAKTAEKVGYNDFSTFSRSFKNYFGQSPGAVRQSKREHGTSEAAHSQT